MKNKPMQMPTPERVAALCSDNQTPVDSQVAEQLCVYLELLVKWNSRCNLVGPYPWPKILQELVLDSWHLAGFIAQLDLPAAPVSLDLGAGAGLPGIPLRVLWQHGSYWLVELREKRTIFLDYALTRLKLPETRVLRMDAGLALAEHAPVHLVLSRAFMPWPQLLELVGPHLADKGCLVCMSNDPTPKDLPPTWQAIGELRYTAAGKSRFFVGPVPSPCC